MLYGLATVTDLFTISDPSDFTNFVSQEGSTVESAASTAAGPLSVPVAPTQAASTTQSAAQPATGAASEWPVLLLIAAGVGYWYYAKHRKGAVV